MSNLRNRVDSPVRGAVTAELAVGMPVITLMLGIVMVAASVGVAEVRCVDAARSAARLAARHEASAVVLAAAHSAGPAGASVRVSRAGDLVRVQVRASVRLPLPGRPTLGVAAASVAQVEQLEGSPVAQVKDQAKRVTKRK